ncbi:MAG: metallopeptidase family protein [Alphaproteobacteria bacterium]
MNESQRTAPSAEDIAQLGRAALAAIPAPLAQHVKDVPIHVRDFAEDEVLDEMGIDSAYDLLGLYQGVSIDQKTTHHVADDVNRVFLYRNAILLYWIESGEDLAHIVKHVLIHEIGHHFGFSDEDMEAIEARGDEA